MKILLIFIGFTHGQSLLLLSLATVAMVLGVAWFGWRVQQEGKWRLADQLLFGFGVMLAALLLIWTMLRLISGPTYFASEGKSFVIRMETDFRIQTMELPHPPQGAVRMQGVVREGVDGGVLGGVTLTASCAGRPLEIVFPSKGFFYFFAPENCLVEGGLLRARKAGFQHVEYRLDRAPDHLQIVMWPERSETGDPAGQDTGSREEEYAPRIPDPPAGHQLVIVNVFDEEGKDLAGAKVVLHCSADRIPAVPLQAGLLYLLAPEGCIGPGIGSISANKPGFRPVRKPLFKPREAISFVLRPQ